MPAASVLLVDNKGKTSRVRSFFPLEVQVHSRNRHDAPWQRSMQVFIKSATFRSPLQATLLFRGCASLRRREGVFRAAGIQLPRTFNDKRADEPFDMNGFQGVTGSFE